MGLCMAGEFLSTAEVNLFFNGVLKSIFKEFVLVLIYFVE